MAYDLTNEGLLQLAKRVYGMGRRHEDEVSTAMLEAARDEIINEENQAIAAQNQAVLDSQMQTWENQGVLPENLARAKSQLARYIGTPGTQPVPGPQTAPAYAQQQPAVASPTQGDLINPANPMKLV